VELDRSATFAYLSRTIAKPVGERAHLELVVRPVALDDARVRFLTVRWDTVIGPYELRLDVRLNATSVVELVAGSYVDHPFIRHRIQEAVWTSIAIDVSFEDRSLRLTARSEGPSLQWEPIADLERSSGPQAIGAIHP
jgi:hypothetical protein